MGALTGSTIKDTYKDLLQVSNANSGIDATLRAVEDGEGTASPLELSSTAVNISSGFQVGGTAITATGAEINYVDGVTSAIQTQLDAKQASDSDLTALAGLSSNGLIARTGSGTAAVRTLTAPAAGITVSNGDGVSGNPTLALANDLSALEAMSGTGLVARTASETYAQRTLTGGGGISVTNGDGASGNPTLGISALQTLWIPASAMISATTSGPASGQVESATNKVNYKTLDFDASSDEYAHFHASMPKGWDGGTVTAEVYWTANSTSTNSVVWGLQGGSLSDNDAVDTAYGTAQTVTDANGSSAYTLRRTSATSAITIAGSPAAGDWCYFRAYRDADNGSDDLAADACLIGLKLFFTINTLDDA